MRPAAALRAFVVTVSTTLLAGPALAQDGIFMGMQKGVESVFSSVSTTTTLASGAVLKTDTVNVYPALTLKANTLLYPGLRMNAGGVFEMNWFSTTTGGVDTTSTIWRNRPFFELRSTNPVLSPGFSYYRREDRSRTAGQANVKLVNDEYAGYLGWKPEGGPQSEFHYLRTHTSDGGQGFQDLTKGFASIVSNYNYRNLTANYRGSYLDTEDRVRGYETLQTGHNGRLSYGGSFLKQRLAVNGTYNVNYQDIKTLATEDAGEVELPVTPFAGLSVLSDTPVTAVLSSNGLVIDGNLVAGAGIDLGLPASPVDGQSRNIGLDFLNPTAVNRLLIWVDRELPVEVTRSFSWEIYSSADNLTWRRETSVPAAPFGPFEYRFEVDFPRITARYLKVVTRPLSPVVPNASLYPHILVTEMQPFLRQQAGELTSRITQTLHLVNSDVRFRILDAPSLYYEGYYQYNGPDRFGRHADTLSNGLSLNHSFGRIYSVYARGAREQGTETRGFRRATVTNANFTVEPLPTLRSTVLYTGLTEEFGGLPNARRGLFIQNAAQPYQGVDVLFGFGWNFTERDTGEILHDRLMNASATIVPRDRVSVTLSYDDTTTTRSGVFEGYPQYHARRLYAAVAVDPVRTLHVVLGQEVIAVTGDRTRTTTDIGVNWSPFPDGTLQFIFNSSSALRALEFGQDRSTLAAVRWNVSSRSYVDVSYQRTLSEFVFLTTASRIFSVRVRLFF